MRWAVSESRQRSATGLSTTPPEGTALFQVACLNGVRTGQEAEPQPLGSSFGVILGDQSSHLCSQLGREGFLGISRLEV